MTVDHVKTTLLKVPFPFMTDQKLTLLYFRVGSRPPNHPTLTTSPVRVRRLQTRNTRDTGTRDSERGPLLRVVVGDWYTGPHEGRRKDGMGLGVSVNLGNRTEYRVRENWREHPAPPPAPTPELHTILKTVDQGHIIRLRVNGQRET